MSFLFKHIFHLLPQSCKSDIVLATYCLHSYNLHDIFCFILVLCFLTLLYSDSEKFCQNCYISEPSQIEDSMEFIFNCRRVFII